jgi:outer membrane protein TolC
MTKVWITLLFAVFSVGAQDVIALKDAVRLALDKNKSIEASVAARNGAEMRISEARSGFLPKVNYSESWARSDNPVFVFSSLLTPIRYSMALARPSTPFAPPS